MIDPSSESHGYPKMVMEDMAWLLRAPRFLDLLACLLVVLVGIRRLLRPSPSNIPSAGYGSNTSTAYM